jgi:L-2-hydroxyglutarate oxidase LhgO
MGKVLFGESLAVAKKMGEDAKFMRSGNVEFLRSEFECDWGRLSVAAQRNAGFGEDQIRYVEKEDLKSVEPNVSDVVEGAIHFPDEGNVNPRRMTKAMGIMAKGAGAEIHLSQDVVGLSFKDGLYHVTVKSTLD